MNEHQSPTRLLPLDQIAEPANPVRSEMNQTEMFALVESMRAVGQLQPIIVKPCGDRYEVVAGHRRLRAAIYLRWPTINATIMEGTNDQFDAAKCHENAFRENIQPEDEGRYFEYLARDKKMGVKEISKFANRSHYYVESRLACVTWPTDIRDALRHDIIGLGAAEALAEVTEDSERQRLLGFASASGVSARTARSWADAWLTTKQAIDVETLNHAVEMIQQKYEEPFFPCYGCERPTPISQLQTLRLCKGCFDDINNANIERTPNGMEPVARISENTPTTQATNTHTTNPTPNTNTTETPPTPQTTHDPDNGTRGREQPPEGTSPQPKTDDQRETQRL